MRMLAALVALVAGAVWVAAGVEAREDDGLSGLATQLWWGGFAAFVLASALTGYAVVTHAPIWLRVVVTLAAAALGASLASTLDVEATDAPLVVAVAGGVVAVLGLVGVVGVLVRWRRSRPLPASGLTS